MFKGHLLYSMISILLAASSAIASETLSPVPLTTPLPNELQYSFNWWQPMVGANTAYATGKLGSGVVVGILDTGINTSNLEFKGRLLPGYNAIANNTQVMDDHGHGTHVAGILGASANSGLTVGIAPLVSLMPIKIFDAAGSGLESSFTTGIQYSINRGARILNLSLGSSLPFGQDDALRKAVNAGQLVVAAAGNNGSANPDYPAQYAKESWAKGQIIAVGALDQSGEMAFSSNRAGNTANYFVVAPGTWIASTSGANQYSYMSGTSMAAPIVSGVAADILSCWPYLRANQLSSIIFQTSTHMGATAVGVADPVYGWGLVNLTKALQPIGPTRLALANNIHGVSTSLVHTNSLIKAKVFSGLSMTATDDFGRGYSYALEQFAVQPMVSELGSLFSRMDKQMSLVEGRTVDSRLTVSMYGDSSGSRQQDAGLLDATDAPPLTLSGFNYVQEFAGGEYTVGMNGFADQYFGLSSDYKNLPLTNNFANPYFQFAGTSSHLGTGYELGDGYKVKMGLLNAVNPLPGLPLLGDSTEASGWVAELEKEFDGGVARITAGAVKEDGSMLGVTGSSAFEMTGAETNYISFSGAYHLTKTDSLLVQAAAGNTVSCGEALIKDSEARTMSWSLGLLHQDALREGDALALAVSQPMKVVSGRMDLSLPTVDENGLVGFESTRIDIASEQTETDFEVGYMAPLANGASVHFNAAYKQNVGNSDENATVVGLRFNTRF